MQYQLGLMYFDGNGVDRSDADALKWLQLAADQGFPPAQKAIQMWNDKVV